MANKILIVEDDLDVADMLNAFSNVYGYSIDIVNWGEDALKACQEQAFDLIILDIRLPDIDGFEVARRLRSNRRTANIPIIFLTEKRERADRLFGLGLGADDYLTKPVDLQELHLRVRNAIQHSAPGPDVNPVSHFPEGAPFIERVNAHIRQPFWAILLVRLENLDAFRARYGFIFADEVLRGVSFVVKSAVSEHGSPDDLIGMLNTHLILVLTRQENLAHLMERLMNWADQSLLNFYPLQDREEQNIPDRLSIRLTAVNSEDGDFPNIEALTKRLAV